LGFLPIGWESHGVYGFLDINSLPCAGAFRMPESGAEIKVINTHPSTNIQQHQFR
jgi:hypothetical protein